MNTIQPSDIKRYNAFCALLFAILIVLQFVPFWELEGEQISISEYIWFPLENGELTTHFIETVSPEFKVDSLVLSSLLQLVIPAVGIVLFLCNKESVYVPYCTGAAGLIGMWSYLSKPAFRLGMNWQLHFAFAILLSFVVLFPIVVRLKERLSQRKEVRHA